MKAENFKAEIDNIPVYMEKFQEFIVDAGTTMILAVITLFVGLWAIRRITGAIQKMMDKREVDPTLKPFINDIIKAALKILLFITIASMIGVQMTSFVAVIGAAGLAVGLALQGSLANFAGGVIILLLKPYKAGEFVEGAGHMGTVREIQIFHTVLTSPDNKTIIVPNGTMASATVINFSRQGTRRLDMKFGVAYGTDMDKVKKVLFDLVKDDERVHKEPEPMIRLFEMADSSVNFTFRVWCDGPDYWPLHWDMNERVYKAFYEHDISIPFPQMDVHFFDQNKNK